MPRPEVYAVGRAFASGVSLIFLAVLFSIGWRLTSSPYGGLIALAAAVASPTVFRNSSWANPNIYALLFITLTLLAAYRIYRHGGAWDYALAGLVAGLAASSKYNAALVVVIIAAAHWLRPELTLWQRLFNLKLLTAIIGAAVGFLLLTPYAVLDWNEFSRDIQAEMTHYSTGHPGWDDQSFYLEYPLQNFAIPFLVAIGVAVYALIRRKRLLLIAIAFPLVYFLFTSRYEVKNLQTFLLIEPFLYLLFAWAVVASVSSYSAARAAQSTSLVWCPAHRRHGRPRAACPGEHPLLPGGGGPGSNQCCGAGMDRFARCGEIQDFPFAVFAFYRTRRRITLKRATSRHNPT